MAKTLTNRADAIVASVIPASPTGDRLEHVHDLELTYTSNAIEGNMLSAAEAISSSSKGSRSAASRWDIISKTDPGGMLLVVWQAGDEFAARFLCRAGFVEFNGARSGPKPLPQGGSDPRTGRESAGAATPPSRRRHDLLVARDLLVPVPPAARSRRDTGALVAPDPRPQVRAAEISLPPANRRSVARQHVPGGLSGG